MQVDNIETYSIIKAHNQVKNSAKARVYKAVPTIATAAIATGLALTQSGKLSTKAATGLGFLALTKVLNITADKFNKGANDKKSMIKNDLLATAGVFLGAIGACSIAKKAGDSTKIGGFIKKEIGTLAKEINATKLAKFTDKKIEPFLNDHALLANIANIIGAFGAITASTMAQIGLSKSLGKDFKDKANENYIKGKVIQKLMQEGLEA